jgi:hypothetical protein
MGEHKARARSYGVEQESGNIVRAVYR